MSWQILTAISVLTLSFSILLQRTLLHTNKADPYAYVIVFQAIIGFLFIIFTIIAGFNFTNMLSLWLPATISIVFYGLGHIVYAKTLQKVEASAFSVLLATQAVWIMILGIVLFHERLTALQVLGSVLIFVGVSLLVKNIRTIFANKGTLLGLLTGFMFGIAITSWSYVGRYTDPLTWSAVSFIGGSLVVLLVRPQSIYKMKPLLRSDVVSKLILLAIFYAIGCLAMLYAYKWGTFTIVSPLRQTSIIVTVLFALIILPKERHQIKRKLIAACICTIGVVLMIT